MRIALLMLTATLLLGCGGMPKIVMDARKPVKDQTLVRVSVVATNYDDAWDKESVRVRIHQVWLNDSGVPTNKEQVIDQPHNGKSAANRGTIKLKEADGDSTRWVRLTFEIVSGDRPDTENISAGTTVEWKLSSSYAEKDIVLVAVLSRSAKNNYKIDAVWAMNPETGETEQVLPSSYES
ncbi:MAG: hypothetical protein KF696_08720 [Planctomycetes bacterium]|nr:hypothetical protein [Planctomycetota bacterium]MCW8136680.1 hypothetical protein [Planctomycetota bacterium]